jgi:hypothetical protein
MQTQEQEPPLGASGQFFNSFKKLGQFPIWLKNVQNQILYNKFEKYIDLHFWMLR